MVSAVSDSYLHNMGQEVNMNRILSPEISLMPPLSMQDRHPSAPQLASMLASSVDSKPFDMMMDPDDQVSGKGVCGC